MDNQENSNIKSPWWREGLMAFMKVSALIAIPIVISLYLGRYLDSRFNTKPWIFLGLTLIAFIISLMSIYKSMVKYMQDLENKEKSKRKENSQKDEINNK